MSNEHSLISKNIEDNQRKSAQFMVVILEGLKIAIANALHKFLILGGSAFEIKPSTSETVSFCRMDGSALGSDQISCGSMKSYAIDLSYYPRYLDLLVQTSYISAKAYSFLDDDDDDADDDEWRRQRTDVISLSMYSCGQPANASSGNSSFRYALKKKSVESEDLVGQNNLDESQSQLPEPVYAVDGSLIYQPLVMWNFEIESVDETTFVFRLHPNETLSCPQYLVVARFIVPPNLLQLDSYGQHFWTMLPLSTSKCTHPNKSEEEYTLYLYPSELKRLKAEASELTKHMKLTSSELRRLYIGYRQLSAIEVNKYDEANPPPIPYPFTYQINTTSRVSVSMPSCLQFTAGDDRWRTTGCKVIPWSNQEEILCECSFE
ncbi:hypothetical protein ACTXT7_015016 [Hymenolepis weldensis]